MRNPFLFLAVLLFFSFSQSSNAQNNLGVENGWTGWKAATGNYFGGVVSITATVAPTAPRFTITGGTGIDACTPGPTPGDPPIPVVAPGFGNASIQLGQTQTGGGAGGCTGGCVEQLTYKFTPTIQDTNLIFSYAIVMQDAGHPTADQPFVEFMILAANGDTIPCGYFRFTGGATLPGFLTSSCGGAYYKPWTTNGVWLSPYVGQTLTLRIRNADCGTGGHFAHSYWDFSGSFFKPKACYGQSLTLCAPQDPATPFDYGWYTTSPMTSISTGQCISVIPQQNDTFGVWIYNNTSGCMFGLFYIPQDTCFVGIEENIEQNTVNISPNPSSGIFFEERNESLGEIEIYNVFGERISPLSIIHQPSSIRIDISSQPPGVYFIRINTGKGIVTQKLILRE